MNDLHKYYGENEVLKGIDTTAKFYEATSFVLSVLLIRKSTFFAVVFNLLKKLLVVPSLLMVFDLTDKNTNGDLVRENIGMVFQHFNLFPIYDCS